MAKKTTKAGTKKKKLPKKVPKEKTFTQTFPPQFSTEGIIITGFRVEIYEHTPFVYEEDRNKK